MSTTDMHDDDSNAVAIIGMAGRFPDAANLDEFWRNLRDGVESVRPVSDDELRAAGVDQATLDDPSYVKAASLLDNIDLFDAGFFGMSPREAELMDPQHRLFLECAWEALEHGGYEPRGYRGAIGLFAGTATSNYLIENIASNPGVLASAGVRQIMLVNDKDFLCGRTAFELDLRGPAVVVQTACSTSLVAVHMACQSILSGESDMALAGGVAISNLEKTGYFHNEGGLYSRDGHCKPFDASASGIIAGSGIGLVLLKSLEAARADGDTIHAVIRGSAINNDGSDKLSFTAPSVEGQAACISEAHAVAGVDPSTITYIEAHGTGTALGDPIEIGALRQAFDADGQGQYCAIGSLKSNLGHLDVAAGIAGLLKATLALKHGELPASLHFEQPNPHIDFANSPFYVNARHAPWQPQGFPRRAGVSSFGIGGTNAHVVLEQAQATASAPASRAAQLLVLSARTPAALDVAVSQLAAHLEAEPALNLADAAYTLQQGRRHFRYRRSVAAATAGDAVAALRAVPAVPQMQAAEEAGLVFMFPGGGTQYVGMGKELYAQEALFRSVVDECAGLLQASLELDIRALMFAQAGSPQAAQLQQVQYSLPALFTIEYALARQLMEWSLQPSALVGHSLGEYVAACVSGVLSLQDALFLVATRGRLIGRLPAANMLAVLAPAAAMEGRLGEDLWLACVNSRESCTISGTPEATARLAAQFDADGIEYQLLAGWPASHSGLMDPILEEFRAALAPLRFGAPQIPYLSNLTGGWADAALVGHPGYWVDHLRHTVRFADGVAALMDGTPKAFVEVGPGTTLGNLVRRDLPRHELGRVATSMPRKDAPECSVSTALGALGQLWAAGVPVDWLRLHGSDRRCRIPMPGYPFERQRYWIARGDSRALAAPEQSAGAVLETRPAEAEAAVPSLARYPRPHLPVPFEAPSTAAEQSLCAIWEEVLGVAPVGVHDDFFALGGNSLIAIQLGCRIRGAFQADLPLRTLFRKPTVAQQACELQAIGNDCIETAIPRRAEGEPVKASLAQQRLWFIARMDPAAAAAYHISKALRIRGPLQASLLHAAMDRLVARHESLRTRFTEQGGEAYQEFAPADCGFALHRHDLSHLAGHELESVIDMMAADASAAPFDLEQGALIRGMLLQISAEEHILVITQHHIISDGWSIGVLVEEVRALYEAFQAGQDDPLPALPIQYADYAAWQRTWLQGDVLQRHLAFWRGHLEGAPALLELPTDRPRPARQTYAGGHVELALGQDIAAGLRALAEQHGTTLFMVLLAGWAIMLARLSGQRDIVIGTPVANRQRTETEGLIGFFVNTLALRVRLDDVQTVSELLAAVKTATLDAYEFQQLPFDQVVEELKPVRSMSHGPVFQVMLNLHNTPADTTVSMSALQFSHVQTPENTAQCDLLLALQDGNDGLVGSLNYASDLFDRATVEDYAVQLRVLLAAMAANPTQAVAQIPLLSAEQQACLLDSFNATGTAFPQGQLMHGLFEAQAAGQPDALALAYGSTAWSYQELNRRANQVAHYLRGLGVQPDDRVALCLERGPLMVAGLLGILKAGAAYVPLDPAYPAQRLAFMLSDSAPAALLTEAAIAALLDGAGLPLVVLDGEHAAELDLQPAANPARAEGMDDSRLAYVIYTSGSTGQPKGVMNHHRGLCNLVHAQTALYQVDASSRVLQFVSLSFDVCVSEIAMALCSGASLHLAPAGELLPGAPLVESLQRSAATHVSLPMAVLAALPQDASLPALKALIVGGEALPAPLANHWSARCRVYNSYGPTETTVCATVYCCDGVQQGAVPIGRPLANNRVYILDSHGQPVPRGVVGEIHIGGVQVARGYLNRPDLTEQRFVVDPFAGEAGARMYRTGDLGRWLADGNIEFAGRNDFQVKIRGFRIELGEIESRLAACQGVREALVVAREDQPGDKRLVAYLVAEAGATLQANELRRTLAADLAEHMLPGAYVVLDAFPLTPNGKIDRARLPAPGGDSVIRQAYEAPQGAVECAIATLWADLLGIEQVGRHDNFFELGGYSLLATQFVARLRDEIKIDIALAKVFEHPTVASLAEAAVLAELGQFSNEDIEGLAADLDQLSDEEIERMLAQERAEQGQ
ncbi:amino acid adenylation domain-containing protein [Duganella sp. CF458]|uniref:non-ribosomal peptide synthetase/type I polyketide synthase n=1 Tax=Duganella sp. CF458 TaxID=1884368 RepID=UPI0008EC21ED|nr:non-ribosomal peptide synthetase/type I polyketide synthase [Duganella sp. CF458]SFH03173.1 amino acid adenylation domain-containing protein [Duganella sp. CF458]